MTDRSKWRRLAPALSGVSCLLLAGAAWLGGCAQAPRQAGILRIEQLNDVNTLDPARAYDTTCIRYVRLLYRGLVDYNQDAELVNEVAADREVSPDGKTYTFHLRRDVHFQTGRAVDAEDFRYAIERVLDPATASDGLSLYTMIDGADAWTAQCQATEDAQSNGKPAPPLKFSHVRGIDVPEPYTIVFHLNKADATFLNYLALPFAYAVPRDWIEQITKEGKDFAEDPDSDGPFLLKDNGWAHGSWLTLVRNPNYFHPELPKCQEIDLQIGIDPSLQVMLFEQGAIDVLPISDALPPDFTRLTHDPKWKPYIVHAPMMDIRYVCMNTELAPFTDKRIRQAMNYAINRERIASFLQGRATLASGALPPGMPGYNPHLFKYPYDPAKARELLEEAGYKDNPDNPITLYYATETDWYKGAALSIQQDLKAVGVTLDVQPLSYPDLKAKAGRRHSVQMAIMGWLQDFPDPADFLDILFNGKNISETSSVNRAFYSNPKVNAILNAAGVEQNRAKRLSEYQDAEKIIVDDAPWVFLFHTEEYHIRQPWVSGYKLHPMWDATYEYVSVN